eukprot:3513911-Alexandrium_andersonii.AAC.1
MSRSKPRKRIDQSSPGPPRPALGCRASRGTSGAQNSRSGVSNSCRGQALERTVRAFGDAQAAASSKWAPAPGSSLAKG